MKTSVLVFALLTCALPGSNGLTFTYQTFANQSVKTTTTVLSTNSTSKTTSVKASVRPVTQISDGQVQAPSATRVPVIQISDGQLQVPVPTPVNQISDGQLQVPKGSSTTHKSAIPTSYTVNPAHLKYPNYTDAPGVDGTGSPGPGLLNASAFAAEAVKLVFLGQDPTAANCAMCKSTLGTVAARMRVQQDTLSVIATAFCTPLSLFLPLPLCIGLLKTGSTDIGGIFPAIDMIGEDGDLLCAFMLGLCPLPPPPKLDLNKLFKGTKKPAPRALKSLTKEPLKVLHISDYHLDLRYVVGSEANCTGQLCCRVFPYTNISEPIKQPASLFGNYLCDTPEPLASSVFRAVPKVTGYDWDDFSFGIFTGDLVSHDIWELTPEYVIAEELASYQQFFDGMGGVKMFPTLGNHDTYPHAFTAFPNQDGVLPKNASYSVQQLYNYENVSAAFENYNWLTAKEAQEVVTSGLGIYRAVTPEGLVIISLNSDVWYYFNLYAYIGGNKIDNTGMFSTLIDYLLEAESKSQAVWLIQHVNVGGSTGYEALPAATDLYYQIIDRFNNTIRGTFFGHTHSDEFGVFYTNNGTIQSADTATSMAYIMPSVTTYTDLNAGFRYYLVDPDTFDVIDSMTYYANASNTNEWTIAGDVHWEFEYSAREVYDPTGKLLAPGAPLSAAFWHEASQQISTNQTMFDKYTDLRSKQYRPFKEEIGVAKNRTLCGLRSMSVPIFERCLNSSKSTTSFL